MIYPRFMSEKERKEKAAEKYLNFWKAMQLNMSFILLFVAFLTT